MYLKIWNEVDRADLPSFKSSMIHEMSYIDEVNGAAIDASAVEREIPVSAVFKALQSFAPAPHIPTSILKNS